MKKLLLLLSIVSVASVGCMNGDAKVTKDEEEAFRHPPSLKDAPPDVIEKMNRDRAKAMGNVPGANTSGQPAAGGSGGQ